MKWTTILDEFQALFAVNHKAYGQVKELAKNILRLLPLNRDSLLFTLVCFWLTLLQILLLLIPNCPQDQKTNFIIVWILILVILILLYNKENGQPRA